MAIINLPRISERYYVYAIMCQDSEGPGYIKIGLSRNIAPRITSLRTACPIPARFAAIAEMPSERIMKLVEKKLHQHFKDRRTTGEWYKFDFGDEGDKRSFNDGCRKVFAENMRRPTWWEKIDFRVLDAIEKERRREFVKSKYRKRVCAAHKRYAKGRRDQKELAQYGISQS